MTRSNRRPRLGTVFVALMIASAATAAQENTALSLAPPLAWTTAEDHQDMQRQLGIAVLRPGPSGREGAPNAANYDESAANPFPEWPDLLALDDGTPVTTAAIWWNRRRPEIVEAFEREVVGRIPANFPDVQWSVAETATGMIAGRPVVGKRLVGRVANSEYRLIAVNIELTLVVPEQAAGLVPVMIMFRGGNLQQALGNVQPRGLRRSGGVQSGDLPATEQLIAANWGFAFLNPNSIQADNGAGLTRGIIGLVNRGQARKPDDWGSLRAWSWGAARALDYLETDPAVDAERVGIEGVSRYGKAALVTMALEPRFALALIGSSGEGGVSPYRRNFGEMVENLTGSGEYHWMAGNFLRYGTAESSFGSANAGDLPVDSHALLALCAPRATFVSYGVPEQGDALWLDQQGSYMATVAAGDVFRLLGAQDLGSDEHYQSATMPAVNTGLLDGTLAWRQHNGGHTDGPNWKYFIPWAERELGLGGDPQATNEPAPLTTVAIRRTDENSEIAHSELLAKVASGSTDVYFVGDSITRRWGALDYPELLANWNENFFGWNTANFGWGGDRTQNILWRLENGELDGIEPTVIVVQAGTNNLEVRANNDEQIEAISAGIMAIVDTSLAKIPDAVIVLTAVFPRSDTPRFNPVVDGINEALASFADTRQIRFLNINDRLSATDGRLLTAMSDDGLHLSVPGYQVWADALTPVLLEILGPPKDTDLAPPATGNPALR